MSDILIVKPEAVLEAAKKCPQAKEVLKTLFPEIFSNRPNKIVAGQVYKRAGDRGFSTISGGEYFLVTRNQDKKSSDTYLQLTSLVTGNVWNGSFNEEESPKGTLFWGGRNESRR
jgi:hypothetical protein